MVSSIGGSSSEGIQQLMAEMYQKMSVADTDGAKGLSKSELLSLNASDQSVGSEFLKSLTEQFDKLDTNADEQLSLKELTFSDKVKDAMGEPVGLDLGSQQKVASISQTQNQSGTFGDLFGSGSGNFIQKLLDSYKNGGLAKLVSSLNITI